MIRIKVAHLTGCTLVGGFGPCFQECAGWGSCQTIAAYARHARGIAIQPSDQHSALVELQAEGSLQTRAAALVVSTWGAGAKCISSQPTSSVMA